MTSTAEALLALRAPSADWLATLVMALDEARRDPDFSPLLARILADLAEKVAQGEALAPEIVSAAHTRTADFQQRLEMELAAAPEVPPVPQPPRLSIVASA